MPDSGVTVLVIDDSDAHRYMTTRVLSAAGYKVIQAATGTEGLELARTGPDLIILDVVLPDLSGFEVARRLKSDPVTAQSLILHLSSGAVGTRDRVEGLEAGADAYLVHPLEAAELLATVKALLRLRDSERRAHASGELLTATFNASPVPIFVLDRDGTIELWNMAAERAFGWKAAEVIGKTTPLVPPEHREQFERWRETILTGQHLDHMQTVRRHRDGTDVEVSISAAPIRDPQGHVGRMVVLALDVTERNRVDRALRMSERMAATGRLAATVAHEINNPLEAVTNLLYLLQTSQSLDPTMATYADMAQRELSRVGYIVKQMLGFYRDSREPMPVRITELLGEALLLYDAYVRRRNIKVVTRFESDKIVQGYAGELRQVFSNLVLNALEAMQDHGRLFLHVYDSRDWTNGQTPGVRVTVADTGAGIQEESMRKLFEPFFTTKGEKGTGLGLWVSAGIVEKHRGKIRVHSSRRQPTYTAFSVFLPLQPPPEG